MFIITDIDTRDTNAAQQIIPSGTLGLPLSVSIADIFRARFTQQKKRTPFAFIFPQARPPVCKTACHSSAKRLTEGVYYYFYYEESLVHL